MHFSSVFTREDTSSIPVPETKCKGSEGERLGQLVVTPEVVVSQIYIIKEKLETLPSMESYLPTSDRHAASWIFSDGPSKQLGVVKLLRSLSFDVR